MPEPEQTERAGKGPTIAAAAVAAALLLAVGVSALRPAAAPGPRPAPGLATPVDLAGLRSQGYAVATAILGSVYGAFALTEEGAIYDGLAEVASGEALEALYLERAGALASGGLPDQTVHELRLTEGTWRGEGGALVADVRWAVLGEVGHAEHTHLRGNAYAATLTVTPELEGWRLTGFALTEVDRTGAGELVTLPEGDPEAAGG